MGTDSRLARRLCASLTAHLDGGRAIAPEGTSPIWNSFMALSRARTCGPAGPNPIGYPEIEAYARLMRIPLEPRHVDAIMAMDRVWMEFAYRKRVPDGVKALPPRSGQPLTPAMFDLAAG
ncbi:MULTISPECIES: phage tail assembly chaperone [unclassified Marinovum]|uniref:phage tail assembly chaperone n=1 Tax=unclassified Marinovum TaxID=2647166 RepID=UPI003EDC5E70